MSKGDDYSGDSFVWSFDKWDDFQVENIQLCAVQWFSFESFLASAPVPKSRKSIADINIEAANLFYMF